MYEDGFYLEGNVGNNAISYEKRLKFEKNPKIFVNKIIKGTINDIKIGKKIVFEEVDNKENVQSFFGLENLIELNYNGKKIYIIDNHNHALFFWAKEIIKKYKKKGISLIHIDQHSDMNLPKNMNLLEKKINLKNIFYYTNFICNVGNFIIPAQKIGLISNIELIQTEFKLLNFENPKYDFILDIDLDFWAPAMSIAKLNKTFDITKKLIKKAKIVTIASSPYFINQDKAIKILKKIL